MSDESHALEQEMDRLIRVLDRIDSHIHELESMSAALRLDAQQRKSTDEPTWGEVTRIARMVDMVDNHADDVRGTTSRLVEMQTDMHFILSGA